MKNKQQPQCQGGDGYSSGHTEISHQSFTPSTPPAKKMFRPTDADLLTPSRQYLDVPGTPMPQINNMFLTALQEKKKLHMHFIEQETLAQQSSNVTSLESQKITTEGIECHDKDASARQAQYAEESLAELYTIMSLSSDTRYQGIIAMDDPTQHLIATQTTSDEIQAASPVESSTVTTTT